MSMLERVRLVVLSLGVSLSVGLLTMSCTHTDEIENQADDGVEFSDAKPAAANVATAGVSEPDAPADQSLYPMMEEVFLNWLQTEMPKTPWGWALFTAGGMVDQGQTFVLRGRRAAWLYHAKPGSKEITMTRRLTGAEHKAFFNSVKKLIRLGDQSAKNIGGSRYQFVRAKLVGGKAKIMKRINYRPVPGVTSAKHEAGLDAFMKLSKR